MHTPTPWTYKEITDLTYWIGMEAIGPGCYVGGFTGTEDNAKFIVRACNSHDELLEALTAIFDYPGLLLSIQGTHMGQPVIDAARAAIAKAKG